VRQEEYGEQAERSADSQGVTHLIFYNCGDNGGYSSTAHPATAAALIGGLAAQVDAILRRLRLPL
jgi:hypothetical protein